jgi:hypothetical protein
MFVSRKFGAEISLTQKVNLLAKADCAQLLRGTVQ